MPKSPRLVGLPVFGAGPFWREYGPWLAKETFALTRRGMTVFRFSSSAGVRVVTAVQPVSADTRFASVCIFSDDLWRLTG